MGLKRWWERRTNFGVPQQWAPYGATDLVMGIVGLMLLAGVLFWGLLRAVP